LSRREVCPFYKQGFCVSPVLGTPSQDVTSPNRCFNSFNTCRFYVNNEEEKGGLKKFEAPSKEVKFYSKINLLSEELRSGCPNYELIRLEKGNIARCTVLDRALTPSQARMCSKMWEMCPYRLSSST
jgi:hypothetical protein